jgi:hypothetical protein
MDVLGGIKMSESIEKFKGKRMERLAASVMYPDGYVGMIDAIELDSGDIEGTVVAWGSRQVVGEEIRKYPSRHIAVITGRNEKNNSSRIYYSK